MNKIRTLKDIPEWLEAEQKLVKLQDEYTEVDQEISRLVAHRTSDDDRDVFADAAEAMLRGAEVALPNTGNDEHERQLRFRRKVLRLAIDQHRREMNGLKNTLSQQLCAEARPEYAKTVKEMAAAAKKLLVAFEKERAIRFHLEDSGVTLHTLDVCILSGFGRIEYFLESAKQAGHI